ncbi:sigma-54 dependent transcriptional regulator [Aquincola sp. J276]|uniref:sigma-54-dependent transcriptional regulator n=1 Tax=Aquincola sp. J276 TaxID=2898432 RepID=UPI00217567F7|nr:sigma-54 dependent transcriptional regulator [Aquincola sp. J276]
MTTATPFSLLVVDDEPDLRTLYELTLIREGYDVETAGSVDDALALLAGRRYSAVITDMRLPDGSGLDLLRHIEQQGRPEKAIVITAYGSAENAVEALKAGAYDYLTKPVDLRQFRAVVASALGRSGQPLPTVVPSSLPSAAFEPPAASAPPRLRPAPAPAPSSAPMSARGAAMPIPPAEPAPVSAALARLVGTSGAMQQVRSLIEKVSRSMAPVLVQGESGTGKELVARAIHKVSSRAEGPFIAVNCGAIPEQLLEAEFFGYRKGAFTGAAEDREGFFQAAHGGTLFLDEIGDLPLSMQSKLLRVIQERAVRPVGAVNEAQVNVRIVSATHKDLAAEVQGGRFRQDLFYRLNVIQIRVPPLRERLDDLRPICAAVLERIARDAGVTPPPQLSDDAFEHLARYAFPGNVRELENLLQRAVAMSGSDLIGRLDLGLPDAAFAETESADHSLDGPPAAPAGGLRTDAPLPTDLAAYLDDVERDILARALERHRYNRTAAGASLGLSLRQMRYRMARLGVHVGDGSGDATADA